MPTLAEQVYQDCQNLPDETLREVLDFVAFLKQRKGLEQDNKISPRKPGALKGKIWIADDFDAPMSDEEYSQWVDNPIFPNQK